MHVHLFNCHGEWAMVAMVVANASLVGVWLRSKFGDESAAKRGVEA